MAMWVHNYSFYMYFILYYRKHTTDLINSWDSLKKIKNKYSKTAVEARQDFKKKGEKVFWIAEKNIQDILKKTSLNIDSYHTDMKFLRDQRNCRRMTLGKKDKQYTQKMEKRQQRRLKHEQFKEKNMNSSKKRT